MTLELLEATLPFYLGLNIVLLVLVVVTLPFVTFGTDSFVVATVTAAFVAVQIVGSSAILYVLRDESGAR